MQRRHFLALMGTAPWLALPAWAHEGHEAAPTPQKGKPGRPELAAAAAFGPDGRLHAVRKEGAYLVVQTSTDLGLHWSAPLRVNAQPEAIAADGDSQPKLIVTPRGDVLVSWTKPLTKPYTGEIRLARLAAGGARFEAPITVHQDRAEITHRFQNMICDAQGRVLVVWIDKRDLEAARLRKQPYAGAALYMAVSENGGRSFLPERKLADNSCECCRIALARHPDGRIGVFWRQIFDGERDHALLFIAPDGRVSPIQRATQDHWKLEACPHHGPALTVSTAGELHATWFTQKDGSARVFAGVLDGAGGPPKVQRPMGQSAQVQADLVASDVGVALVWKEFDGERTRLRAQLNPHADAPATLELDSTHGASDQPRALVLAGKPYAFWHLAEGGLRVYPLCAV